MSDLIEREVAIDRLNSIRPKKLVKSGYQYGIDVGISMCIVSISEQPSADPGLDEWCTDCKEYDRDKHCCPRWNRVIRETLNEVRKKGKWIHDGLDFPHGVDWMHCSKCGMREIYCPATMTNYCPNCGAYMRGEEDG